jgi:hypothetical protein
MINRAGLHIFIVILAVAALAGLSTAADDVAAAVCAAELNHTRRDLDKCELDRDHYRNTCDIAWRSYANEERKEGKQKLYLEVGTIVSTFLGTLLGAVVTAWAMVYTRRISAAPQSTSALENSLRRFLLNDLSEQVANDIVACVKSLKESLSTY